jgi:hypothetical protein
VYAEDDGLIDRAASVKLEDLYKMYKSDLLFYTFCIKSVADVRCSFK